MKHSQRIAFFEAAYDRIRQEILSEAPPEATIAIGFTSRKRSGKNLVIGECAYDCMREHGGAFGAENLITIHPIACDDIVKALATLLHEMIHASLEPGVGHKKPFQVVCKRVGLLKPWTATEPDGEFQKQLRSIAVDLEGELGYMPSGHYVPPPPGPTKPPTTRKLVCDCSNPRTLSLSLKKIDEGAILCGVCKTQFHVQDAVTR